MYLDDQLSIRVKILPLSFDPMTVDGIVKFEQVFPNHFNPKFASMYVAYVRPEKLDEVMSVMKLNPQVLSCDRIALRTIK